MARDKEEKEKMHQAAKKAREELDTLLKGLSAEELKGVEKIRTWFKTNHGDAGYKKLAKIVAGDDKNSDSDE